MMHLRTCDPYLSSARLPISSSLHKFVTRFSKSSAKVGLNSLSSANWIDCCTTRSTQWEPLGSKQRFSIFSAKVFKRACKDATGHSEMYLSKKLLAVLCFAMRISFPFSSFSIDLKKFIASSVPLTLSNASIARLKYSACSILRRDCRLMFDVFDTFLMFLTPTKKMNFCNKSMCKFFLQGSSLKEQKN